MLQWCVRTYEATYNDGTLEETLLKTVALQSIDSTNNGTGDDVFTINVDGKSFGVIENTTGFMEHAFRVDLPFIISSTERDNSGNLLGMWNFIQEQPYDINPYLVKVATAMTNAMRSRDDANSTEAIQGIAWGQENFVEIRWVWMTLPEALLIANLIFVAATILTSRKDGTAAWKSSALATLLHGLSKEAREQFDPHISPSEVKALSRKLRVKLSRGDDGITKLGLV
ncbi:hypothetical protein BCR34DRAFT_272798 [Clohesyomyces aquaticus]|uniref:Uncharacterized protein n=1 Tax=Clohesyomyces aquaticus TaxID=1231657 RepID=A0A1Y1ZTA9_9PLEO|nr:hypothetical protein BCR34DRAFT_272798 [Clohesyomyces aquaticus]